MKVQGYMLNPFGIILFYKVVGWFDLEFWIINGYLILWIF
jgi:hypothetical protein